MNNLIFFFLIHFQAEDALSPEQEEERSVKRILTIAKVRLLLCAIIQKSYKLCMLVTVKTDFKKKIVNENFIDRPIMIIGPVIIDYS